ncbi:MAG TPA: hypothetical protein DCL49_03185, partial [Candidatus Omnitrophica bacterium]|nr:hypothetical protein [Candidatus Omnitrophota bacterium]HBG63510.1 hypothetical protein [Candidatus Omnitrophota bacterium]
ISLQTRRQSRQPCDSATNSKGFLYVAQRVASFKTRFEPQIFKKSFLGLKISFRLTTNNLILRFVGISK